MAVMTYREGDHAAGYVGHRVDTTVGRERVQEYFPECKREEAEARNAVLREEAEAYNRRARVWGERKANQLAVGLCAVIHRETHRYPSGVETVNYVPGFRVSRGGKQSCREYRTSVHGYKGAYRLAVKEYVSWNGLDEYEEELLGRCPEPEVFTEYLYGRMKKRWRTMGLEEIRRRLRVA